MSGNYSLPHLFGTETNPFYSKHGKGYNFLFDPVNYMNDKERSRKFRGLCGVTLVFLTLVTVGFWGPGIYVVNKLSNKKFKHDKTQKDRVVVSTKQTAQRTILPPIGKKTNDTIDTNTKQTEKTEFIDLSEEVEITALDEDVEEDTFITLKYKDFKCCLSKPKIENGDYGALLVNAMKGDNDKTNIDIEKAFVNNDIIIRGLNIKMFRLFKNYIENKHINIIKKNDDEATKKNIENLVFMAEYFDLPDSELIETLRNKIDDESRKEIYSLLKQEKLPNLMNIKSFRATLLKLLDCTNLEEKFQKFSLLGEDSLFDLNSYGTLPPIYKDKLNEGVGGMSTDPKCTLLFNPDCKIKIAIINDTKYEFEIKEDDQESGLQSLFPRIGKPSTGVLHITGGKNVCKDVREDTCLLIHNHPTFAGKIVIHWVRKLHGDYPHNFTLRMQYFSDFLSFEKQLFENVLNKEPKGFNVFRNFDLSQARNHIHKAHETMLNWREVDFPQLLIKRANEITKKSFIFYEDDDGREISMINFFKDGSTCQIQKEGDVIKISLINSSGEEKAFIRFTEDESEVLKGEKFCMTMELNEDNKFVVSAIPAHYIDNNPYFIKETSL